jgi:hypothetical protein
MNKDKPICEGCGQEIEDGITLDVWGSATVYDDENKPEKTGEVASDVFGRDYVVFGTCCRAKVKKAWGEFLDKTTVEF